MRAAFGDARRLGGRGQPAIITIFLALDDVIPPPQDTATFPAIEGQLLAGLAIVIVNLIPDLLKHLIVLIILMSQPLLLTL